MRFAFILLFCMPSLALASGYGGASGKNKRGEIIHIGADVADTIYVQKNAKDHVWKERYVLLDECPSFRADNEDVKQFSCRHDSRSPLAGTTYRVTTLKQYQPCNVPEFEDKSPGEVYVCIAGCHHRRAPAIFYVSPWEC
ncbi:MAG TPA: hypothetical protein VF800_05985 [Telluria sp.]|jgi:hypothetical protein